MEITIVKAYTEVYKQLLRYIFRRKTSSPRSGWGTKGRRDNKFPLTTCTRTLRNLYGGRRGREIPEKQGRRAGGRVGREIERISRIPQPILWLWIIFVKQPFQDNEYQTVLINGLAVFELKGRWIGCRGLQAPIFNDDQVGRLIVVQRKQGRIRRKRSKGGRKTGKGHGAQALSEVKR